MFFCLLSCKSNYTKIGDKNANYIPYYLKVNEADSLFLVGNYQKSHKILDSLFKKYEPANSDYFFEYGTFLMSCVKTGDTIGIKNKIKYAFRKYGGMYTSIDPIDAHLFLRDIYQKDSIIFLKLKNRYLKKIDMGVIKKIQDMSKLDQDNRCLNTLENNNRINSIDSINGEKLKDIIRFDFYPNYYEIGYFEPGLNENAEILTLLLHQDRATVFKYLPIIEDAVKKGKCSPFEYALIYDKCMWVYGEENEREKFNSFEADRKQEIESIVKKNRKEIGLPSLEFVKWKSKL
jgi:hypothetical protein